jgi:leucyl aminopeptidase
MAVLTRINFAKPGQASRGTVVILAGEGLVLGDRARALGVDALVRKAAATAEFTGKAMATLDILAPAGVGFERLAVAGTGKGEPAEQDWLRLGGVVSGTLGKGRAATVLLENPNGTLSPAAAADFALGAVLRSYAFDKYKPSRDANGASKKAAAELTIVVDDVGPAKAAWASRLAVAEGVTLARDLINEPANVLGPVELAGRAGELAKLGVDVEVLTEKDMKKLGMRALLGVSQGSPRPPRIVVMRWKGGKAKDQPIAFIGKGVVFDSGGISIKPGAGMEDMKGDMGGAAAVVGLMRALAGRKAKVNAIGVIAIVENMPDGVAQRPGDIVAAMSGRTIEIINTDAEGRLILADAIHYTETRLKPKFMIDLATLTGAIVVALGHHHAGLFSNDDALADRLRAAGEATAEKVWRMPLGPEYDKMIDSRFADVKNTGGRMAGSITGAQFLQRFVDKTPWAHLDIAGTAIDSPSTEINRSWASGWGVRLLDRLVSDYYEDGKPLKS